MKSAIKVVATLIGLLIALAIVLVIVTPESVFEATVSQPPLPATPTIAAITVRYEVWSPYGRGWASITYTNANGDTEQLDKVTSGWTTEFTAMPGSQVYISAQNAYEAGGTGCRVYADGVLIHEAESKGAYVIATCSGKL